MPKQTISKARLIDTAYAIAEKEGLSALSIRKLATACSIATGSVYTYFPTKADLVFAVVERFFTRTIVEDFCHAEPGEGFVHFIRRFKKAMDELMGEYASTWRTEIQALPLDERERGREAALDRLGHVRHGLVQILRSDSQIASGVLVGALDPEVLAAFVTDRLIASLRDKDNFEPQESSLMVLCQFLCRTRDCTCPDRRWIPHASTRRTGVEVPLFFQTRSTRHYLNIKSREFSSRSKFCLYSEWVHKL